MATPRDWAEPFLNQAGEDLRAAQACYDKQCDSTFCMLLQMTFEKLAKAAIARGGQIPPHSHSTASELLLLLARDPRGPRVPGYGAVALDAIRELERSHPSYVANFIKQAKGQQYPQLEYPWENPATGTIEWPSEHLPILTRLYDAEQRLGATLLKFARGLEEQFNALFP